MAPHDPERGFPSPWGRSGRSGAALGLIAFVLTSAPAPVTAQDARSPVTEDPTFVPVAQLLGSSDPVGQLYLRFGNTVSVSGDTLVVGAPQEDTTGGTDAGAAYVYVRSGNAWMPQARLAASDAAPWYEFGRSVSVSGDTAVVGAPRPSYSGGGKVYVFVRSGAIWTEQQKLMTADPFAYPFGASVSVSGDTAVVGASATDGAGAAYVFVRTGTSWTQQARFNGSGGNNEDAFGGSVSASGDTILVGAGRENGTSGPEAGAVHVFVRGGTSWTEQAKLIASDAAAFDGFGGSVSISGDTAVVGAPSAVASTGAAYVFVRSGTTWTEQQKLVTQDTGAYHSGTSVSVFGDTAVVGGPSSGASLGAAGTVFVYARSGTTWAEQPKVTASDAAAYDEFGASVSLFEDTLVVGAPRADAAAGAAYAFARVGTTWTEQEKLSAPASDVTASDHFGQSVSVSGDTVVVGAPDDDRPLAYSGGSAYVFMRSGAAWSTQKLTASNAGGNDHFGTSVAVSGDTIVVGAPDIGAPAGFHGYGFAYAFVREGAFWREQQILGESWTQLLGVSVSVSGDTAVVGGPGRPPYYDTGVAYVYVRSGTMWTEQQHLLSPLGADYDQFGSSVSVYGETLAVADSFSSSTHVFQRSGDSWSLQQTVGVSGPVSIYGDTLVVGRHVFVRSGATWTERQVLTTADGATTFSSVQVSGDRLVAGRAHAAYVFERVGAAWVEQERLVSPDAQPGDGFGASVSVSGETVVVGDPSHDTAGGPDAGSAYVFEGRVVPSADLWVRKTDGRAAAVPGQAVTYSITVANAGPDAVEGAAVADTLPAALACTTTCSGTGGATCTSGPFAGSISDTVSIPAGQFVTYTAVCTVSSSAVGTFSNTATVTAPATVRDPYPGNNSATDTDTLDPAADLAMVLTQSADTVSAGGVLDYLITVGNLGPWPSTAMTVTDVLPSGTSFLASIPGPGACSVDGDTLTCALGPLPPGETHTVSVEVEVAAGARGVLRNTASVAGHEPDPVAANDSDTVSALVSRPTQFFTLAPCRVVDTRAGSTAPIGGPALAARSTRVFALAGHCGIPTSAQAVALNVTVTGAEAAGNLRFFPAGLSVPLAAVVSYREGQTRGNNTVVALDADGEIGAYVAQAARTKVHVIIDVAGYFE